MGRACCMCTRLRSCRADGYESGFELMSCDPSPMTELDEWSRRVEQFWENADDDDVEAVLKGMRELVAERPAGDPAALLEWAGAHDSVGLEAQAVPLYPRLWMPV